MTVWVYVLILMWNIGSVLPIGQMDMFFRYPGFHRLNVCKKNGACTDFIVACKYVVNLFKDLEIQLISYKINKFD